MDDYRTGYIDGETSRDAEIESLRQQLADSQKQVTMLRDAIERNVERMHFAEPWSAAEIDIEFSRKALAATEPKTETPTTGETA